jgi:hypothetical protein
MRMLLYCEMLSISAQPNVPEKYLELSRPRMIGVYQDYLLLVCKLKPCCPCPSNFHYLLVVLASG